MSRPCPLHQAVAAYSRLDLAVDSLLEANTPERVTAALAIDAAAKERADAS